MTQHKDRTMDRKAYDRPQVRRVKLETVEATLGTGCQNIPQSSADGVFCQSPSTSCDVVE
jgi:hypothetical protein